MTKLSWDNLVFLLENELVFGEGNSHLNIFFRLINSKEYDKMIIMGLDPGLAIVGYGFIEKIGNSYKSIDYDAITTPAGMPSSQRLKHIYKEMLRLIELYQPDELAIEELFFNKNVKTAISVAQARGVEILSAQIKNIPIYEYTPLQVKQGLVGYGRADKKQIQHMVKILLNLPEIPKPDDVADALAIALTHGHTGKFKSQYLME